MPESALTPERRCVTGEATSVPPRAAFVELGLATCFSFLRGASDAVDLVTQAYALGYDAIGIADANTMAGVVRLHGEAQTLKLRPVIGCRIETAEGLAFLAYPADRAAYGRLCALIENSLRGHNTQGRPHDILMLSGDIHCGRYTVGRIAGVPDAMVPELIASPASMITPGLGGTAKPQYPPAKFIFDDTDKLLGVILKLPKHQFDTILGLIESKYPNIIEKQIPLVGDKFVKIEVGNSLIFIEAPHMDFSMTITYVTKHILEKAINDAKNKQTDVHNKNSTAIIK